MMDPTEKYRPEFNPEMELIALLPTEPISVPLKLVARDLGIDEKYSCPTQRVDTLIMRLQKIGIFIARYKDGGLHGHLAIRRDCRERAFRMAWRYVSEIEAAT